MSEQDSKNKRIKLIIISDVHHNMSALESLLPIINSADRLIFCGDGITDIMRLRGRVTVPITCARGNNDFFTNVEEQTVQKIGETNALVTHGHKLGVRYTTETLAEEAIRNECSIAFFGHTHIFCDRTVFGVHVVNPGALCDGSYAVAEGDSDGFYIKQGFVQ